MNVQKSATDASEPVLCMNCKTFYGCQNNNWLCSSCFKYPPLLPRKGKKQTQVEVNVPKVTEQVKEVPKLEEKPEEVKIEVPEKEEKTEEEAPVQVDRKRCFACKKKVGLLGVECKCTFVFCNGHRMPEDHKCSFNFKAKGLKELQKKVVKVEKGKIA